MTNDRNITGSKGLMIEILLGVMMEILLIFNEEIGPQTVEKCQLKND